ncbi:hypothetical protein F2Q69_00013047 [Brassica cretica]|uniref:Uncharacterized protein n=1 Tax=Brassica cretica TaxID=69181 RepID=A0A8S9R9E9_BRACR|nr:hypothetical protein F2Q69_00013047 [Brassica cretica]
MQPKHADRHVCAAVPDMWSMRCRRACVRSHAKRHTGCQQPEADWLFYGFRLVEVLLDTPPGSPKNCPEAKGGSVRVQISLPRPVSFFMVKPRLCPRQDQSSPLHSSRPLGIGHVLSDQPAASRLEHCRYPGCDVDTTGPMPYRLDYNGLKETPYSLDREDSDERGHVILLSITRRCNVAVTRRTVGCRAVTRRTVGRGRLKVPSSGLCGRGIGYCR